MSINQSTVTLTLASAVATNQTVTVSYTKPNSNPIRDLSGQEADSFTNREVEQVSDIKNLTPTPLNGLVTLSWDRITDSDLTRYQYRYRSTADTGWNPDWTNMPDSDATTTSFTAQSLTNGIEYTFEIRPVYTRNGQIEYGRQGRVESAPRGDLLAPMSLGATTGGSGQMILSWDDPQDVTITGYEYRYKNENDSDWNPDWTPMPGSDATTTTHTLSNLEGGVIHTFELRAIRGTEKGPPAVTEGEPVGATATSTEPYTRLTSVGGLPARRAFVDLTVEWEPMVDEDKTVSTYVYRIAEGSSVPSTEPWKTAANDNLTNDKLAFTEAGLKPGTTYRIELEARGQENSGIGRAQAQVTSPIFTGPHYTVSAEESVKEGETVTITVSRTTADGESSALVEVRDTYNNGVAILDATFGSADTSATATFTVSDDGDNITDRELTLRVSEAGKDNPDTQGQDDNRPGGRNYNTFSVEWHTVKVVDTSP